MFQASVSVTESVTGVVRINAQGPQGPRGEKPITYPGITLVRPELGDVADFGRLRKTLADYNIRAVVAGDGIASITFDLYTGIRRDTGTQRLSGLVANDRGEGIDVNVILAELPAEEWMWLEIVGKTGRVDSLVVVLIDND